MAWPSSDFSSSVFPLAPRPVYLGRSQSEARLRIAETIERREGVVVLTGESGTGKTTLCQTILQGLPFPTVRSDIVNPHLRLEDLLRQILLDLGVVSTKAGAEGQLHRIAAHDLVLLLNRFLESMPPETRAVLVLDDAHQIPRSVLAQLRTLANLQTRAGRQLLQIILIGRPRLESLFKQPQVRQLKQRVACHCRLDPLDSTEVAEYVRHRIKSSSLAGRPPAYRAVTTDADESDVVSEPALNGLATLSRGIPRTLNLLCDSAVALTVENQAAGIGLGEVLEAGRRLKVRPPMARRLSARAAAFVVVLLTIALAVAVVSRWNSRRSGQNRPAPAVESSVPISPAQGTAAPATPPDRTIAADRLPAEDSYVVVVASFRSRQRASDTAQELIAANLPAFVRDDDEWHVLVVGPYVTEEEAREASGQISRARFSDAHVMRSGANGYRSAR